MPTSPLNPSQTTWITHTLAQTPHHSRQRVGRVEIALRTWGDPDLPKIVLIHGMAAHSGWWDSVAPALSVDHEVIAIDLSGHGDSGRHSSYSIQTWANEAMSIATADRRPAILIGHSLGGLVALTAARSHGARLRGCIVVDSPLHPLPRDRTRRLQARASSPLVTMATSSEAVTRFRPMPDEGGLIPTLVERVASQSIRSTGAGYQWKVDPRVFSAERATEPLGPAPCPIRLVRGEHGMLSAEQADAAIELFAQTERATLIPGAGHHIMLSHPRLLSDALSAWVRELPLSQWT
ncbi:alpha/beta fold hydrolase [Microbacterium fluvii]|uniref:Alpha/beta fold hydrolase n=1 Tax=Microbacterium fluvii TaxID=415215 RepID=A0ABW2HDK3_9MICO|nr:alpha/beta hydrolase [Microbacterium fluvii]MCU4671156.1 alpha/beta hydrolase [Microbacterium fluvii]